MSDTPKFEVIDRRKIKAAEEQENSPAPSQTSAPPPAAPSQPAEPHAGPRLVVPEDQPERVQPERVQPDPAVETFADEPLGDLPPAPTAEESRQQKSAYDASAQRIEDLVRAQNPGVGAPPPVSFENLVQQLYLSAMIQMGAGTQEGQRPRVDVIGARQTIDLLGILAEKTRGNLTAVESQTLETVLFEARMAFLELTNMITLQGVQAPPPPPGKR